MRQCVVRRYKMPKNMGVAPRFDTWNEKYEPWEHMKRMGRLVGTGFYIPPEWYNHFRMFPPINHNFQQEKTLNPHNASEPTQDDTSTLSPERVALRDELARKSRLVASEGMRYYNIFWVRKPLDTMEKEYYELKRRGVDHGEAIRKVLQGFYSGLAVKKRVAAIQAEEAKLTGRFITMREATVVLGVLAKLHKEQLTPHQVSLLAKEQGETTQSGAKLTAIVSRTQPHVNKEASSPATSEAVGSNTEEESLSADALASMLSEDGEQSAVGTRYQVEVKETANDSVRQLREKAEDQTGFPDWYTGESPTYSGTS
ncbi:uncharacterized protein TEOVI_000061200 [Trypanosoma equiperdum]|uniref:Uncharacterized protein n=2 Tax=Trypanozoon TaxID=39700 RepID=Q57VB2_TRYB2|nr:hypothetical protein, conserved [Trypanosoma brucei brucei TREU927]AAX70438.1 hypothetical protein, conserved [Trypanosoma brucei]AAZ11266.1 hypothetical protein, conserved [Trypanosoma brucei brucei TREU927]SCU69055.1 hypothetical protein, conserved [Trypanosoma equiperdum]